MTKSGVCSVCVFLAVVLVKMGVGINSAVDMVWELVSIVWERVTFDP